MTGFEILSYRIYLTLAFYYVKKRSWHVFPVTVENQKVEVPTDTFWIAVKEEYPSLVKKALTILMQFSTSYLCELAFSTLRNIKSKQRERLCCTVLKKKREFVFLKYILSLKPLPKNIKHMFLNDRFVALLSLRRQYIKLPKNLSNIILILR